MNDIILFQSTLVCNETLADVVASHLNVVEPAARDDGMKAF